MSVNYYDQPMFHEAAQTDNTILNAVSPMSSYVSEVEWQMKQASYKPHSMRGMC
jgi:hypothetical protein